MFTINTRAPWFLMQGAARVMIQEWVEGTIVKVLSISSHAGQPYLATYVASKAALAAFTKNSAHALLEYRIRVNALNPGWMASAGEDRLQREYYGVGDGWREKAAADLPFGDLIDPDDAARAVLFLASLSTPHARSRPVGFDRTAPSTRSARFERSKPAQHSHHIARPSAGREIHSKIFVSNPTTNSLARASSESLERSICNLVA
jgi:hypothetical protein